MKLNGGRKINITNGFNRTLLHNELNQRKLFKDVDTFDDLYQRRNEDYSLTKPNTNTKKIIKKSVNIEVLDYSLENSFKVSDDLIRNLYNSIKNFIMSYQDFNYLFSHNEETLLHNNDEVIYMTIKNNYVVVSYLLTINRVNYYINNEQDANRLLEELKLLFEKQGFEKNSIYSEINYLKDYPICENAVIMDEDIIDNLPFKEILKK